MFGLEPEVFDSFNSCEMNHNMSSFLKKGRSLFVIVPTSPIENYENFTNEVLEYNKKEPFNFDTPPFFKNRSLEKVLF